MGRKRKITEEIKTSKSIRLSPKTWEKIKNEQKKLNHKYFVNTIQHIINKYFNH